MKTSEYTEAEHHERDNLTYALLGILTVAFVFAGPAGDWLAGLDTPAKSAVAAVTLLLTAAGGVAAALTLMWRR